MDNNEQPSQIRPDVDIGDEKTKVFNAEPRIYLPNGWLSNRGNFWGCQSDEHDTCARFITRTQFPEIYEQIMNGTEDERHSTARRTLFTEGFAQLSHNNIILPANLLSPAQIKLIDAAGLKVPITITDKKLRVTFIRLLQKIDDGTLTNRETDLVNHFFENGLRYSVDDSDSARILFDVLTEGMKNGGDYSNYGWSDKYEYRYPKNEAFVVELNEHTHDGATADVSVTSRVVVRPYSNALDLPGFAPEDKEI